MSDPHSHHSNLEITIRHISELIDRQAIVSGMVEKQEMHRHDLVQTLVEKQGLSEVKNLVNSLHPADIAFVLENLPLSKRKIIWDVVEPRYHGAVLLEMSNAVRETLLSDMELHQIFQATDALDSDEIADLFPELSDEMAVDLLAKLDITERERVKSLLAFPEGSVGALMDLDFVDVQPDQTLDEVLEQLRRLREIPRDSKLIMVLDRSGVLLGTMEMDALLVNPGSYCVRDVMNDTPVHFRTDDDAGDAANAFKRYDLISVPVVNAYHQLVGSLNIESVLDYIHETSQKDLLGQVGLHEEEEDLFAPVWRAAKNRWHWLALNLLIAFVASRIIDQFEHTIAAVVALAALMPITANIGGNAGNQSLALVIRGLSTKQLNDSNMLRLMFKETRIGFINGTIWGAVMAVMTLVLYGDFRLAILMQISMILTLVISGMMGVLVPATLKRFGHDPVLGSSIVITGVLDTLGFFIFLGLAGLIVLKV